MWQAWPHIRMDQAKIQDKVHFQGQVHALSEKGVRIKLPAIGKLRSDKRNPWHAFTGWPKHPWHATVFQRRCGSVPNNLTSAAASAIDRAARPTPEAPEDKVLQYRRRQEDQQVPDQDWIGPDKGVQIGHHQSHGADLYWLEAAGGNAKGDAVADQQWLEGCIDIRAQK